MNKYIAALQRRSKPIKIGGIDALVVELSSAADLTSLRSDDMSEYNAKLIVACTFEADGKTPAFTDADIPELKKDLSAFRLTTLLQAVTEVNGMDTENVVKNSEAAPTGG